MADVWLAPYLPLAAQVDISVWRLVPFRDLARRHTVSQPVLNEVRRLRTAYRLTNTSGMPFGALLVPREGRIGDEQPRELLRPLHRALVAALLDGNPSFLDPDPSPNAGHHMVTSENAVVYGHPLHGGSSYAISTGAMVQSLNLNHVPPGRRLPRVQPPNELPTPIFAKLDKEYATALYNALARDDTTARRLDRAIEWLALAWNNSAAISEDARVLVFRAGFEVLLGGGADTKRNRELLSELLDEPDADRSPRSWPGLKSPVALTHLQWWFQSFATLRNKVAHGDAVEDTDRLFEDGKRHLWHADDVLRRAVKRTVVRAGADPLIELPAIDRYFKRAYGSALAKPASEPGADVPLGPPA
jgi:hypothetical protein